MKIGLDYQDISLKYTGGTTSFAVGLLNGLVQTNTKHDIVLFVASHNRSFFEKYASEKVSIIELPNVGGPLSPLRLVDYLAAFFNSSAFYRWAYNLADRLKRIQLRKEQHVDLIFTPSAKKVFYGNKPSVVAIHDIQQAHFPEFFSPVERRRRDIIHRLNARFSTFMQASSDFIKKDFLKYFENLKNDQVIVIPEGVNIDVFSAPLDTNYLETKYNLEKEYIYYPGQLWHHKNHICILRGLQKIRQEYGVEIPLVMTGAAYSSKAEVLSYIDFNKMNSFVKYLGAVPFDDVRALYQKARILVSASIYESSSLPVREAAASGCAILVSDIGPNREAAEMLKMDLYKSQDFEDFANNLWSLWNNSSKRNEMIQQNLQNIQNLSWNSIGRTYLDFFEKISPNY